MKRTETPESVRNFALRASLREALAQEAGHEKTNRFRVCGPQLPYVSYRGNGGGNGGGNHTPLQTLHLYDDLIFGWMTAKNR